MSIFLCFLFVLLSSATACDRCLHQTRVSYFPNDSVLSSGACGYGSLALGFNGRNLAAGVPSLYKDGTGCGACFQKSFMAMANTGMRKEILKQGVLDVEYKRIPCNYKHHNLSIRVEESSKYPDYLEINFLYQGGQTEIIEVHVSQPGSLVATQMSRKNNSAVWKANGAPNWELDVTYEVIDGIKSDMTYSTIYWGTVNPIPADWKPGAIYDSGFDLKSIMPEICPASQCDPQIWK